QRIPGAGHRARDRSSSVSLSARDTLIAEQLSARLRAELLGGAFVTLLTSGLIKVGRWYGHLAAIAAISPLYSRAIWRSLLTALRGDSAAFPRDFSKLLGLAKELQIALREACDDAEARAWLETSRAVGSSPNTPRHCSPNLFVVVCRPKPAEGTAVSPATSLR
ncbi:MAG TPA: hypothetical protein VHW01_12895, partial [Polyangiaceae bacterium]|nr:hypothetical protein [Polyangiaceae bacterium]